MTVQKIFLETGYSSKNRPLDHKLLSLPATIDGGSLLGTSSLSVTFLSLKYGLRGGSWVVPSDVGEL